MKKILLLLIFIYFLSFHNCIASEKIYENFDNVKVISNYDGDTLTVDIEKLPTIFGSKISVRVFGIDTPEMHGKCEKEKALAMEAKEIVRSIINRNPYVSLLNTRRDKYFRILADVETIDGDLAKILLDKGLAVQYNGGTKEKNWCE